MQNEKLHRLPPWIERTSVGKHVAEPTRWITAALFFLVLLLFPSPLLASCVQGGVSSATPPTVTFLRSYRNSFAVPARLATDSTGNIYAADPIKGEIFVRAPDGRVLSRKSGLGYVISLAVDGQGRVYAGDGITGTITVFDSDWQQLFMLGAGVGEFLLPNDIGIDLSSGRVYVTDSKAHRVKVYDSDGRSLFSFGGLGTVDGAFDFPAGIFVNSPTAEVFVTDQLNSRVQVFDPNGNFIYCFGRRGSTAGRFNFPQGVWVDARGRIFVADAFDGRVQVLERDGDSLGFIAAFGAKPGETRVPVDLVIDSSNRLFIAAANNARLEVFGIDSFSDPEIVLPAEVRSSPTPVVRGCTDATVVAWVEIPGYPLDAVDMNTITANGVPPNSVTAVVEDTDRDSIPELRLEFDRELLLDNLADPGAVDGVLRVSGSLSGKIFEAESRVEIVDAGDADGDGVCDEADACDSTLPGKTTDAEGCVVYQLCPCAGPGERESWLRHAKYVTCIRRKTHEFMKDNLMSWSERRARVQAAKQSGCGGLCPESTLTNLADVRGCVDRLCPCRGPAPGLAWKKQSRYSKCVWRRARQGRRLGLITWEAQRAAAIEARQSSCGAP